MKRSIFLLLLLFTVYNTLPAQTQMPVISSHTDKVQWMEQHFGKGKTPPFSFVYGGKKSDSFLKNWQYKAEKGIPSGENEELYIYTYTDSGSGLEVTCSVTCFTDFPAVEWVVNFKNTSGRNTPVIENVTVLDRSFVAEEDGPMVLHYAKGSDAGRDDFAPIDETMAVGRQISMIQTQGRSSSHDAFPFFNVAMSPREGMVVAVGWTGRWFADVTHTKDKTVAIKSGLQKMQSRLYPNEEIRSPRICLLFWEGENRMVGHNNFRQFVLKHHSRKINNQFAEYPISGGFSFGDPSTSSEYECLTETYALAVVDRHRQLDIIPEIFWLDAGWYENCECGSRSSYWWSNAGNWTAEKTRFPNGLRPIADAIHQIGSKFMVWFEPERVSTGSMIHREHSEWLIKPEHHTSFLFDLGNEEACSWMTNYICDIIEKEGIDYYRQDFNFDPAPYWDLTDKPGRIGITENKHVQGLYRFWDSMTERFPNLLIDNCAGGGRRIDLETISRSAPLWRTDYQYGEPVGKQCHTYALNFYIPLHGTGVSTEDNYNFLSGLSSAAQAGWLVGGHGIETNSINRKYMNDVKELRPYFYGDYYPLTSTIGYTNNNVWLAYQMNRPEQGDGIIIAFRRANNVLTSIPVKLAGLEKDATYELYYEEYDLTKKYKGSELMEELNLTIRRKPESLLIRYKKVN